MSNEFIPLTAPRVVGPKGEKPVPVSWFQHVAPRIPEAVREAPFFRSEEGEGAAKTISFLQVDDIAFAEQRLRNGGDLEPAEVTVLRLQAQNEAQRMVGEAFAQAETIEKAARELGYSEGYQNGYADGTQEALRVETERAAQERAALQEDLTDLLQRIEAERQRVWAALEPQAMDLIFALCKLVLKQEIEASRNVVIPVIQNALRRVADEGTLRIRIHTADLEVVRSNRQTFQAMLDGIRAIEIIEDRRVGQGGCIVETEGGTIDARLETQLEMIGDVLDKMVQLSDSAEAETRD